MKRLLLSLSALAVLFAWPAEAEEIGAFFTKVNTYIYHDGPEQGRRILVRPRHTFAVVDVTSDREERIWFQIVFPGRTRKVKGEGWTPLAPHELMSTGSQPVEIYRTVPGNPGGELDPVRVPATDLELLNATQPDSRFPQLTWQRVRYATEMPLRPWIRAATGIYRPTKSVSFVNEAYAEMVSRNLEREKLERLLSGVIRVGDTTQEVEWALGEPLRVQEEAIANAKRTTWQYPSLVVQFENQVVEQIN